VVNPEIVSRSGSVTGVEGCLSVPGVQGEVCRAETVLVRGLDEWGNPHRIQAAGILSRALQHEIDHLDGILFIERVSSSAAASAK
jgi:peptide deformylase